MLSELKQYLASVKACSKLDPREEKEVVRELQAHFEDEISELCHAGFSKGEAADEATKRLGEPETFGREIYEVYSQGTWNQALLAALPHFMLALTFSLHLWQNGFWIFTCVLMVIAVTIYAWRQGRPSWFYSWLSYSLIPLFVIVFLALLAIAQVISRPAIVSDIQWVVVAVFVPVALSLLGYAIIFVVRKDWLLASFMLFPFPAIIAWLFTLEQDVGLVQYGKEGFESGAQGMALTFLALGVAAGTFIRLRQRSLKIGILALATFFILGIVWRFAGIDLNPVICLLVSVCFVSILLSPWLLQNRVSCRNNETEVWDEAFLEQATKRI